MNTPTFRDIEQISAYLDGELNQTQKTRLEARIHANPALAEALEELRQVRTMLRKTPHRRAPRNFTLTPKMAGIRPPVPRLVPALSWASAVAAILFIFTLGINLLGSLNLSAATAAPKAADLYGAGGVPVAAATAAPATVAPAFAAPATAAPATAAPATAAPAFAPPAPVATHAPGNGTEIPTATAPETTIQNANRVMAPSTASSTQPERAIPWTYIWLGLAILLVGAALLIRLFSERAFARRTRH